MCLVKLKKRLTFIINYDINVIIDNKKVVVNYYLL